MHANHFHPTNMTHTEDVDPHIHPLALESLPREHSKLRRRASYSYSSAQDEDNASNKEELAPTRTKHVPNYVIPADWEMHGNERTSHKHTPSSITQSFFSVDIKFPPPIVNGKMARDEIVIKTYENNSHRDASIALLQNEEMNDKILFTCINNNFDLTVENLEGIFLNFDLDKDQIITYAQFRECLRVSGLIFDDEGFNSLCAVLDADHSNGVTLNEFLEVSQRLKLGTLFESGRDTARAKIKEHRYNCIKLEKYLYLPSSSSFPMSYPDLDVDKCLSHSDFFDMMYNKIRLKGTSLVNVSSVDPLTMARLGIKYRLHPLAILDAINLDSRPTVERYKGHLYISAPHIQMQFFPKQTKLMSGWCCNKRKRNKNLFFRDVTRKNMSVGSHSNVNEYSMMSDDEKDDSKKNDVEFGKKRKPSIEPQFWNPKKNKLSEEMALTGQFKIVSNTVSIFVIDESLVEGHGDEVKKDINDQTVITVSGGVMSTDVAETLWKPLYERLNVTNSKVRVCGSQYLLYAVLDTMVDSALPILETLKDCVETHQVAILNKKYDFEINKTLALKRELQYLLRVLRPMAGVLRHCIDDHSISDTVALYLRDVNDKLMELLEDAGSLIENCNSIRDEYSTLHNEQMNMLMYVLTVFTSMFIPPTLIAGVYGMNWPTIPEFNTFGDNGYYYCLLMMVAN